MSSLLEAIEKEWSWKTGKPVAILAQNAFGNVIIRTEHDFFYRIIPEDLKCVLLGTTIEEVEEERATEDFKLDWDMKLLVDEAEAALGKLADGESYHLVIPGPMGGKYDISNIKIIRTSELLGFAGTVARQIENLPDGTKVRIEWT